jgi:hypothetical protein
MGAIVQSCATALWLQRGSVMGHGAARDVVARYLRGNEIPLGMAAFGAPADPGAPHMTRAWVAGEQGAARPDLPHEHSFSLVIEYSVPVAVQDLHAGIKLYNERGVTVLHSSTIDDWQVHPETAASGAHRVSVRIPGGLLAPGRYVADVAIASAAKASHYHLAERGLAFDITGQFPYLGDEVLRPKLEWQLK